VSILFRRAPAKESDQNMFGLGLLEILIVAVILLAVVVGVVLIMAFPSKTERQ
jgi:hypothetical protein